ncbi:hypothetical protein ACFP3T_02855 [Lactiplantibacillus dongliensis]|uniref:Integral membrane protein n=1 Tax=Lactiplantibacillus dongliensis TaxID=2559919 RepID=A0ABW1R3S0_9LACO|nr:hypothetical protein [Lactiplantibacillus dongliensis]
MKPENTWILQFGGILISAGVILAAFGWSSWPLATMILTALPLSWGSVQLSKAYSSPALKRFFLLIGLIMILDVVLGLIWFRRIF